MATVDADAPSDENWALEEVLQEDTVLLMAICQPVNGTLNLLHMRNDRGRSGDSSAKCDEVKRQKLLDRVGSGLPKMPRTGPSGVCALRLGSLSFC